MSERHRALPLWMSKEKEKEKVKEPLKSKRKQKAARSVFYCMNEKELVEAAVSYLTSARGDLPTKHQPGPTSAEHPVEPRRNPGTTFKPVTEALVEESSDSGDAQDTTYVSESDLDITEAETVPYLVSTEDARTDKVKEVQDENKDGGLDIQDKATEDDAFQLVKDIFFT